MGSKSHTGNPECSEEFLLCTANAPQGGQTRSRYVNVIPAEDSTICPGAYTPPPWEIFYEFVRLVCLGFTATFGPRRV